MNKQDGDRPAIIAFPPLLMAICIAAGLIAARFWPNPMFYGAIFARTVSWVALVVVAGALTVWDNRELVKHDEHPNPYKPTDSIVESGIYSFTRNPLYLALLLIVLAVAIGANDMWLLVSLVVFFLFLHFGVVIREERYLSEKFGARYEEYQKSVRRWI